MKSSRSRNMFLGGFDRPVRVRGCDCHGCDQAGDFRAPKGRTQLTEYYWFCLAHVRDYNARWDYFAGLSAEAIEGHIRQATVWERPTWPLGDWQKREQQLRDSVEREFFGDGFAARPATPPMAAGEREALAVLELVPPVDFAAVKAQYRILVKRHHPDANGGSSAAGEKFKIINQAFATLRAVYGTDDA